MLKSIAVTGILAAALALGACGSNAKELSASEQDALDKMVAAKMKTAGAGDLISGIYPAGKADCDRYGLVYKTNPAWIDQGEHRYQTAGGFRWCEVPEKN